MSSTPALRSRSPGMAATPWLPSPPGGLKPFSARPPAPPERPETPHPVAVPHPPTEHPFRAIVRPEALCPSRRGAGACTWGWEEIWWWRTVWVPRVAGVAPWPKSLQRMALGGFASLSTGAGVDLFLWDDLTPEQPGLPRQFRPVTFQRLASLVLKSRRIRGLPVGRTPCVLRRVLLLAGALAALPVNAQSPEAVLSAEAIEALRGDYGLSDGRIGYLGGWPAHGNRLQRLFLEIEGERLRLYVPDPEWFVTAAGDTLRPVLGGTEEQVTGLSWTEPGGRVTRAGRLRNYDALEVGFEGAAGTLAGTLHLPSAPGPHPGVVLVHGSGPDSREPYRNLAAHFARSGVAALVYDKRGMGGSAGDWRTAGFEALAGDAIAAVRLLREHPAVDPERVGLWGISQGGWILPLAASQTPEIAFIIPVSASGHSPARQEMWRVGNNLLYRELSPAAIAIGLKGSRMVYSLREVADRGWLSLPPDLWFAALDPWLEPAPIWEQVTQPVLAIWGEIDGLVHTGESVEVVRSALDRGGNTHYSLRVLPGADHGIFQAIEGFQNEPRPRTAYAEGYLGGMVEWIHGLDGATRRVDLVLPSSATPTRLAWQHPADPRGPAFGGALVQVPLVLAMVLFFGGVLLATAVRWGRRRLRATTPPRTEPGARLAAAASLLVLVTMVGWAATLVPTVLEGGTPFLLGTPLALLVGQAATAAAAVAFVVLGFLSLRASNEEGGAIPVRNGIRITASGGIVFLVWAAYWHLLPFS